MVVVFVGVDSHSCCGSWREGSEGISVMVLVLMVTRGRSLVRRGGGEDAAG